MIMQKYQNTKIFLQNAILLIGQKFFAINKVKNTIPWAYVNDLIGEEIFGMFYKKELQKLSQEEFRNGDGDKLYVKWKGYDHSFISWINKKRYCIQ